MRALIVFLLATGTCLSAQAAPAIPTTGEITGQAFIQPSEGAPKTCAGQEDVQVFPETAASEIEAAFKSSERGFFAARQSLGASSNVRRGATESGDLVALPLTTSSTTTSACDATGRFKFPGLSPGVHFVISKITWSGGREGGYLMRRVALAPGQSAEVILSTMVEVQSERETVPEIDKRQSAVERAVRGRLLDPGSAQFQWSGRWQTNVEFKAWRWSKPIRGDVTCGRVNAKNRFGGYVGQTTFLAVVSNGQVLHLEMDGAADSELTIARMRCQRDGFF